MTLTLTSLPLLSRLRRALLPAIMVLLSLSGTGAAQTPPPPEPWKVTLVPTYALGTDIRTETGGEVMLRGFGAALEVAAPHRLVGTISVRRLTYSDVTCLGVGLPCSARSGWSALAGANYMILTPGRVPVGAYLGAAAGVVDRDGTRRAATAQLGVDLPVMTRAALRFESSYLRFDGKHSTDPRLLTWTAGLRVRLR